MGFRRQVCQSSTDAATCLELSARASRGSAPTRNAPREKPVRTVHPAKMEGVQVCSMARGARRFWGCGGLTDATRKRVNFRWQTRETSFLPAERSNELRKSQDKDK